MISRERRGRSDEFEELEELEELVLSLEDLDLCPSLLDPRPPPTGDGGGGGGGALSATLLRLVGYALSPRVVVGSCAVLARWLLL